MLHIILADSELELVPKKLRNHPSVRANAQRRERSPKMILLDSSLHHSAMTQMGKDESSRRGRPDIVHQCINISQDSIAVQKGLARLIVHTRNDDVIEISPNTRPPRSYNRFIGLFEKLLSEGDTESSDKEGNVLMKRYTSGLWGVVDSIVGNAGKVIVLDDQAKQGGGIFEDVEITGDMVVIIGGFPHGDFRSELEPSWKRVAIHDMPLTATACLGEVLVGWRMANSG